MSYFYQNHYKYQSLKTFAPQPTWNSRGDPIQYCLTLGGLYGTDNTILWQLALPQQYSQYTQNQLIIRKGQINIQNVAAGYPTNIYIAADSFNGYLNKQGSVTNNLACFSLSRVVNLGTSPASYNLVYRNQADIQWQIPQNVPYLTLRVYFDENPAFQTYPLGWTIPLKIDITRTPERKQLKMIQNFIQMEID